MTDRWDVLTTISHVLLADASKVSPDDLAVVKDALLLAIPTLELISATPVGISHAISSRKPFARLTWPIGRSEHHLDFAVRSVMSALASGRLTCWGVPHWPDGRGGDAVVQIPLAELRELNMAREVADVALWRLVLSEDKPIRYSLLRIDPSELERVFPNKQGVTYNNTFKQPVAKQSLESLDAPLVEEMHRMILRGKAASPNAAANLIAKHTPERIARGSGESQVRRLVRRYQKAYPLN